MNVFKFVVVGQIITLTPLLLTALCVSFIQLDFQYMNPANWLIELRILSALYWLAISSALLLIVSDEVWT